MTMKQIQEDGKKAELDFMLVLINIIKILVIDNVCI